MDFKRSFQRLGLRQRYAFFRFRKALRSQKKQWHTRRMDRLYKDRNTIVVLDESGKKIRCHILFTFDDDVDNHYIVYTDGSTDDHGNTQVYASTYDLEGDSTELSPIETDEMWEVIEGLLKDVQEKIQSGELTKENDDDDEVTDDEALLPLGEEIYTKCSHWTEKLHFPVGVLPFYIIGLILIHSIGIKPMPLWMDIGIVALELVAMRISYVPYESFHLVLGGVITIWLYYIWFGCILSPMVIEDMAKHMCLYRLTEVAVMLVFFLWERRKARRHRCG